MYSERDTTKRKYRGIAEQRQLLANALDDKASLRFIHNQGWDFPEQIGRRYLSRFTRMKKPHSENTSQDIAPKLGRRSYLLSDGVGVIDRTPEPWREVSVNRVPSLRSQIATSVFDTLDTPSCSVST